MRIKTHLPVTLLVISFALSVLSYFGFYPKVYEYLGDIVGYSILTSIYMISVVSNFRYCLSVKIACYGLLILNVFNLIYSYLGINGDLYDILICGFVLITYLFYKLQKK